MNDNDLTPEEKKAFESLPKERQLSPFLEERTVQALRKRGILRAKKRFFIEFTPFRLAGAVAASLILIIGVFYMGYLTRSPSSEVTVPDQFENTDLQIASSLQYTGSTYLSSLETLTSTVQTANSKDMAQSREVALNLLHAVASETVNVLPNNDLAANVLRVIEDVDTIYCTIPGLGNQNRVIWF